MNVNENIVPCTTSFTNKRVHVCVDYVDFESFTCVHVVVIVTRIEERNEESETLIIEMSERNKMHGKAMKN